MLVNCHSYFSLRYGTIPERELLRLAAEAGYRALALTDINSTSGCLSFLRLASEFGVHPAIGVDFRNGMEQLFVGIARTNDGFLELNNYLSAHLHTKTAFPSEAPSFREVAVIYPFRKLLETNRQHLGENEYIGIAPDDLRRFSFGSWAHLAHRMVLLKTVSFRGKRDYNLHRLLRAIDGNTLLSKLTPADVASDAGFLLPPEELCALCAAHPFLIYNTEKLLETTAVRFGFGRERSNQNLRVFGKSEEEDYRLLAALCEEALPVRYHTVTATVRNRLEKELVMIRQMGFVPFFLINHEIIRYARHKDYYYVGRGSGANSIVAYLLQITNVDPVELDLYFERFINLYRASPPDFDIDFSSRDREDVTRYIFERFGKKGRTALLGSYSTFQGNAARRELGKVMGLPPAEIDRLGTEKAGGIPPPSDKLSALVLRYAGYMQEEELPNHLSVHAGGILIAEKPIHGYTATFMPPKGFPTTQFDMLVAEDVGLNKLDILGQRGLTKIKECQEIIRYNRPEAPAFDIDDVGSFLKDEKVNNLIKNAACIGCFYVESPAMRMLLKKLEVDNYLGLVAASSIIRPGVAQSGMMREYILRHRNAGKRTSHPLLLELMEETYGVMVYQEDVIKVAHLFGGLTLGEADVLRRGMNGKFRNRSEFREVRGRFFENCRQKGYDENLIREVWTQMESFAGYAFAKGHSASYAVESYQTLFLKAYFPLEFMVAVLNSGGGFYGPELYIQEARLLGGVIHAPDIHESGYDSRIRGKEIFLGMSLLSGLEERFIRSLLKARETGGAFVSFSDFVGRVPCTVEQISLLIRIGAFRFTGEDRKALLWKAYTLLQGRTSPQAGQSQLFQAPARSFQLPAFDTATGEDAFEQIELLGFPLCSPFELLREPPVQEIGAADLHKLLNRTVTIYACLVIVKNTFTSKGERMQFGTFTDRTGAFVDTVHYPPVVKSHPFRGKGIYRITGKVADEFGFLSIEVAVLEKMPYRTDPRYAEG